MHVLKSKKMLVTLVSMILVTVGTLFISDMERLQWFVGIIGSMVATFNVGQGIADGLSKGQTSADKTATQTCKCS